MEHLIQRMIRAARLEPGLYEEVEHDHSATGQALQVVVISSVAAGIGSLGGGIVGLINGVILAVIGWVVWAAVIWLIGTRLLPGPDTEADLGQLLRTLGFATAPGVIRVLGFIPLLGWLIGLVAFVWLLATTVIAVRQALDYRSTSRAIAVCLIGWAAMFLAVILLGGLFRGARPLF